MTTAEIVAIASSAVVVLMQALKYDDKKKDRVVRVLTAFFAILIVFLTAWTTSRSKLEADAKEAKAEIKQTITERKKEAEIAKLDSTHKATVHTLDSTNLTYLKVIDTLNRANREEIRRAHILSEKKLDYQYSNNMSNARELLGLISSRTAAEFVAEKVLNNLSFERTQQLIRQAILKFLSDSIYSERTDMRMVMDSTGYWYFVDMDEGHKLWFNYKREKDNTMIYFDAFLDERSGPPQSNFISVILDNNIYQEKYEYNLNNLKKMKTVNLYYQYRHWFEKVLPSGQMGNYRPEQDIIFILSDDNTFTREELLEYMDFQMSFNYGSYIMRETPCDVIIYHIHDLHGFQTNLF